MTQEQNPQDYQGQQRPQAPTREGLKINALLERIAGLENERADLRVDFTVTAMENNSLRHALAEAEAKIPAEVVEDEAPASEAVAPVAAD